MSTWISLPKLPEQFPLSTDSVLLADFTTITEKSRIFDLGAGPGTLGLLLCAKKSGCHADGIELQTASAEAAQSVIRLNNMEDRVSVTQGDLREIRAHFPANCYDVVVSNPPYFPVNSGFTAQSEAMAIARTELHCTLPDLCQAAAYLLRYGGIFTMVHRPERLCDIMTAMRACKLEPKQLRLVCPKPDAAPALILIESKLGGKPGLTIRPNLILHQADGTPTEEYNRIYGLGGI